MLITGSDMAPSLAKFPGEVKAENRKGRGLPAARAGVQASAATIHSGRNEINAKKRRREADEAGSILAAK
jgi:hypothetical protein